MQKKKGRGCITKPQLYTLFQVKATARAVDPRRDEPGLTGGTVLFLDVQRDEGPLRLQGADAEPPRSKRFESLLGAVLRPFRHYPAAPEKLKGKLDRCLEDMTGQRRLCPSQARHQLVEVERSRFQGPDDGDREGRRQGHGGAPQAV